MEKKKKNTKLKYTEFNFNKYKQTHTSQHTVYMLNDLSIFQLFS